MDLIIINKRRKLSMNKTELIAAIAEKAELSKKDADENVQKVAEEGIAKLANIA